MTPRVLFAGGNGHCRARLDGARAALGERLEISELEYPGFEGRVPAASFDAFLETVREEIQRRRVPGCRIYGTGIGGLILLALRARGLDPSIPLLLQAPVLWGLETRAFPLWMRLPFAGILVRTAFQFPLVQAKFARKYFALPLRPETRAAFFNGYARCHAFCQLFDWFVPALLRDLEAAFRADPARLGNISVWWGGKDAVLPPTELEVTETALGVKWPLRLFPGWGHYPMLDDPSGWARELLDFS